MARDTEGAAAAPSSLPDAPNLDWLRKQAKRRLAELREVNPKAKLAQAQLDIARQYGFKSWRSLKSQIDAMTVDGRLFELARDGDVNGLRDLLDENPAKINARANPYQWTLLHEAAHKGHLAVVNLLLQRGFDPNTRESGDNTYAMHWAAAAGHLDVVRRLADAGGDVVGRGDDHELEVIGWATSWEGCDDDAHRAVADFLVSRGAHHHIFSAIAQNRADEVRRIVSGDPAQLNRRLSRNENNQLPLHFAVRMNRPEMVSVLLELGADPLAVDGGGQPAATYAKSPEVDRPVMEAIRAMTSAEIVSARRGKRSTRAGMMDLVALVSLSDWEGAERLLRDNPDAGSGALHLMAKRGDARGVRWLLDHGADPNARWAHWDSDVTALHLAVLADHPDIVRLLVERGADPHMRDTKHDSDAIGWAEFFGNNEILQILRRTEASRLR